MRGVMLMSGTLKFSFQAGQRHFEVGLRAKPQLNDNVMQNQLNCTDSAWSSAAAAAKQPVSARVTGNIEQRGQRVLKHDTRTAVRRPENQRTANRCYYRTCIHGNSRGQAEPIGDAPAPPPIGDAPAPPSIVTPALKQTQQLYGACTPTPRFYID